MIFIFITYVIGMYCEFFLVYGIYLTKEFPFTFHSLKPSNRFHKRCISFFPLSKSLNSSVSHLVLGRIATAIIPTESVTLLLEHFRHSALSPNSRAPGPPLIGATDPMPTPHWSKIPVGGAPLVESGGTSPRNFHPSTESRPKTP